MAFLGSMLGSLGSLFGGSGGSVLNGLIKGLDQATEGDQVANLAEQARHNSQMQWQSTWFNEMMDQRSENMREGNELRDLAMGQRKADASITKEFIKSIGE